MVNWAKEIGVSQDNCCFGVVIFKQSAILIKNDAMATCMCEENLLGGQLVLAELGDRVGGSGGEADHAAVRGRDGEREVGSGAVRVLRPELRVGDGDARARPHDEARVVDEAGDGVVDGVDGDLERGGDARLVLVGPLEPRSPRHQHHLVLHGVTSVVNVLKYFWKN